MVRLHTVRHSFWYYYMAALPFLNFRSPLPDMGAFAGGDSTTWGKLFSWYLPTQMHTSSTCKYERVNLGNWILDTPHCIWSGRLCHISCRPPINHAATCTRNPPFFLVCLCVITVSQSGSMAVNLGPEFWSNEERIATFNKREPLQLCETFSVDEFF